MPFRIFEFLPSKVMLGPLVFAAPISWLGGLDFSPHHCWSRASLTSDWLILISLLTFNLFLNFLILKVGWLIIIGFWRSAYVRAPANDLWDFCPDESWSKPNCSTAFAGLGLEGESTELSLEHLEMGVGGCDLGELFLGGLWDSMVYWDWIGFGGLTGEILGLLCGVSEGLGFGVFLWLVNKWSFLPKYRENRSKSSVISNLSSLPRFELNLYKPNKIFRL